MVVLADICSRADHSTGAVNLHILQAGRGPPVSHDFNVNSWALLIKIIVRLVLTYARTRESVEESGKILRM